MRLVILRRGGADRGGRDHQEGSGLRGFHKDAGRDRRDPGRGPDIGLEKDEVARLRHPDGPDKGPVRPAADQDRFHQGVGAVREGEQVRADLPVPDHLSGGHQGRGKPQGRLNARVRILYLYRHLPPVGNYGFLNHLTIVQQFLCESLTKS